VATSGGQAEQRKRVPEGASCWPASPAWATAPGTP